MLRLGLGGDAGLVLLLVNLLGLGSLGSLGCGGGGDLGGLGGRDVDDAVLDESRRGGGGGEVGGLVRDGLEVTDDVGVGGTEGGV